MAQNPLEDVTATLKDAAFVSVGLAVIGFQRLQVRRHELNQAISAQADEARGVLDLVGTLVGDRLKTVEERVGAVRQRGGPARPS